MEIHVKSCANAKFSSINKEHCSILRVISCVYGGTELTIADFNCFLANTVSQYTVNLSVSLCFLFRCQCKVIICVCV